MSRCCSRWYLALVLHIVPIHRRRQCFSYTRLIILVGRRTKATSRFPDEPNSNFSRGRSLRDANINAVIRYVSYCVPWHANSKWSAANERIGRHLGTMQPRDRSISMRYCQLQHLYLLSARSKFMSITCLYLNSGLDTPVSRFYWILQRILDKIDDILCSSTVTVEYPVFFKSHHEKL